MEPIYIEFRFKTANYSVITLIGSLTGAISIYDKMKEKYIIK